MTDTGDFPGGYEAASPPLVGREADLTILHDAYQQAVHDHGCIVLVSGEAGNGRNWRL